MNNRNNSTLFLTNNQQIPTLFLTNNLGKGDLFAFSNKMLYLCGLIITNLQNRNEFLQDIRIEKQPY